MDKVLCAELKKVTDELLVAGNFMAAVVHGLQVDCEITTGAQYGLEEVASAACDKLAEAVERLGKLGKESDRAEGTTPE